MKLNKGFNADVVSDSYWFPVHVDVLDEQGKTHKFQFDGKFQRLSDSEQQEIFSPPEGRAIPNDNEIVNKVFLAWRYVYRGGEEVPITPENREWLLSITPTRARIVVAWMRSIGIEGKVKN